MVDYLLQESFEVKQLNPGGEKFDRVTRIEAEGLALEMYMQLDVNNEVYPLKVGDKFKMVLVSTINLDGTPDTGYFMPGRKTIADDFDYVMHGKLYRISEKKDSSGQKNKTEMLVSFAGLLMLLRGEPHFANKFELDQKLFLLTKKL